jgi:hypothetical protein
LQTRETAGSLPDTSSVRTAFSSDRTTQERATRLAALRLFYEDGLKYSRDRDFPKFPTDDQESWVELSFRPQPEDFEALNDEYKESGGMLTVRKYLDSAENDDEGKPRS